MHKNRYDFVMAGGGAAGLSLAYHLLQSPLSSSSILIVDPQQKTTNDRTWCFWSSQPTLFDEISQRAWKQLLFLGIDHRLEIDLGQYTYRMIRGIDFYNFTRQKLAAHPNVEFVAGRVEEIEDGEEAAQVTVDGRRVAAGWVFDSRFRIDEFRPQPGQYHYLKQHFLGWQIETPAAVFDPQTPTLFDFRTPQRDQMRFFYVLPLSSTRALVEFTIFSPDLLTQAEYEEALTTHLKDVMGIDRWRIEEEEQGVIPMTDQPFKRRLGRRILATGSRGGRVKPSSGYAFLRIQKDSAAIVRSLLEAGHPFALPADPLRYRLYDSIMLQVMYRQGGRLREIFSALFKNNPIERVFSFLDEEGPLWDNILLMASLPARPFLKALARLKLLRRI